MGSPGRSCVRRAECDRAGVQDEWPLQAAAQVLDKRLNLSQVELAGVAVEELLLDERQMLGEPARVQLCLGLHITEAPEQAFHFFLSEQ